MIVGAQKCGTTALSEFLNQHSRIQMAEGKEVHLFDSDAFDILWSPQEISERYEQFFAVPEEGQLLGEATPVYLFFPEIAGQLASYNPELKIIVVLRDPVERAYSHYRMERGRGNESKPFWLALLLESFRLKRDPNPRDEMSSLRRHSYRTRSLYSDQLANLLSHFPEEQVLVIGSDNLRHDHQVTLAKIFEFLELPDEQIESKEVFSQPGNLSAVPVSAYFLRKSFRPELEKLSRMVDFPVSDWR